MSRWKCALVEQRHLHRPGFYQPANGRGAQCAVDPVQSCGRHFLTDARLGEHAPVAHQHHLREPKPPPQLVELRPQGHGIGSVVLEHLHRHRTTVAVAQQAELDLKLSPLAVAGIAVPRRRTAAAFQIDRGEVVKHQGARPQDASWPSASRRPPAAPTASPWPRTDRPRLISPNSRVCANESRAVASASPRAVASFETSARTRARISASTLSRSTQGEAESRRSRPSLRTEPSTAAT